MAFAGRIDWKVSLGEEGLVDQFAASLSAARSSVMGNAVFVHGEAPAAQQPLTGADGCSLLLFSGYVTNRDDLIQPLALGAGDWPDSTYALAALERWGPAAVARLEGAFALAYWDQGAHRLLLASDHMGMRPLYYHQGDGWLVFATSPAMILALPGVPRAVDERRLANVLMRLSDEPERSFHAAIRRLPAASVAVFSGGQPPVIERYWQPDYTRRLSYRHDQDYVDAARELLDRAVRVNLRGLNPVVAQITGGLDSSAVAATAARLLAPAALTTLTAVSDDGVALPCWSNGRYLSERPFVEAISRQHANLHPIFLSGSPPHAWDEDWETIFRLTAAPRGNVLNNAWLGPIFDHARSLGASTVLSGSMGNLTLSWNGREGLTSMMHRNRWLWVLREARALSRITGQSVARILWGRALRPRLPVAVGRAIDQLRRRNSPWVAISPLNPAFVEGLDLSRRLAGLALDTRGGSSAIRRQIFESTQDLSGQFDSMRLLTGIDRRCPLTDRRLIEFCFAVPEDQYLRGGVTRFLARRVLADRLPAEVVDNTKIGIQCADGFQRMDRRRAAILAGVEELELSPLACRIIDVPRLKALATHWPADAASAGPEYHMVLYRGLHFGQFLRWVERGAV